MANFSDVIALIDEKIKENGVGAITGPILNNVLEVMLQAVGLILDTKVDSQEGYGLSQEDFTARLKEKLDALPTSSDLSGALSNKVDKVTNKSLILNSLITKLENMPYITDWNHQYHRITISDGNGHTQIYQLTPYMPTPDYYIGFCDSYTTFNNYTDDQLVSNARYHDNVESKAIYPSANGYVYYGSGEKCMYILYNTQYNLLIDIDNPGDSFDLQNQTPADIDMFNRANVVRDGKTYKVVATYDASNTSENGFRFKFQ